ncbi:MAG: ATP-dependent DNA helicase [Chitinivibrionales bacterium]|nr:ATP-dependent DNA helicase [Chitinivibrionales bacterium]
MRISVGELVAFACRSGDLETGRIGFGRQEDPIKIHQKIQKSRPADYRAEVAVVYGAAIESGELEIGGRIDGVYTYPDRVIIEEIKTTFEELGSLEQEPNLSHWAQAQCYAFIYAEQNQLSSIEIQLTYYQCESKKILELRRSFSHTDLSVFFHECISSYSRWIALYLAYQEKRNASIQELRFPFAHFRAGQRALAAAVYRAIRDRTQQFIQAPTGIGKTMGVLFPAIKALGENGTGKIFYLTARTTGKESAEKALAGLRSQGLVLKSLTLTAKNKICFNPGCTCSAGQCSYAKGYYDRLSAALSEAFAIDVLDRRAIETIASEHQVCPFEFSLDLSLSVDCIICDYNYAFDPRVHLRRFFEMQSGNHVFLVDEVHNLIDRSREMFSASLDKKDIASLRKSVKDANRDLYAVLGGINRLLRQLQRECDAAGGSLCQSKPHEGLVEELRRFAFRSLRILSWKVLPPYADALQELFFKAAVFISVCDQYDGCYRTCYENKEDGLRCTLFCIDPSTRMAAALNRCVSAIFFSATITPISYFRTVLGCSKTCRELILGSPFPAAHLQVCVARVSTRYGDRASTKTVVACLCSALLTSRPGNYIFYFPSYEYLQMIYAEFVGTCPTIQTAVQKPDCTDAERNLFLGHFHKENPQGLAGFAVMGGVFGEGIDLIGDRLSGVAIVGPGLPGINQERELIRDYFDAKQGDGFKYAYQYPGINKVLQAAGRVIRTEADRGVVLLIDERFLNYSYCSLLPAVWQPLPVETVEKLSDVLLRFWHLMR